MIVLDAAAVPDAYSGARTRLRGLLAAYARLGEGPPLGVLIARGSTLLAGVELGSIRVEEVAAPGGPARRALRRALRRHPTGALARAAALWHSETIPPLGPRRVPALLTLHDVRWAEPRAATAAPWRIWAPRHVAARTWLPKLARSCAGIVTVSASSSARIVAALRVERAHVHVVPNATVLESPPPLEPAAAAALLDGLGVSGRSFFLAVGHLEPRKGLELVLAALAQARPGGRLASARLVLVGLGAGEDALRDEACRLGITERLVCAGPLDERAVASLHQHAAALVFPSRYEGFGFPVHEARAHGCPVVARDLPAVGELAGPDVTQLGADPGAWRAALERLAAAPPRPAGVQAARTSAPRVVVTWSDAARTLAALYRSLS